MVKLSIEKNSKKPKYLLLADSITSQIEQKQLVLGQRLPSVNKLSAHFNFSRETVFKALNHLSEKGIVRAVDKIGYFVNDLSVETKYKVFFMLDKFTPFKEDLYNSLISNLGENVKVRLYFHHQNIEIFAPLILDNLKNYTHFVVTTYIKDSKSVQKVLNQIPPEKLIILDKYEPNVKKGCGMVFQDFENDIFNLLAEHIDLVKKYRKLVLFNRKNAPHGDFVQKGFERFGTEYNFTSEVYDTFSPDYFEKGALYITIDAYDRDMVEIIKLARKSNWKLGKDIGLISYNDTSTKEILDGGISVISTDFKKMGAEAAKMILEGHRERKSNETKLILRNSL
ncbi:GntR family transcriptional regulator [Pseudozobellia thermophila]|uniref:Transcriptional regulator, GntR family n=1 Tax=Pseudozobellia thermophila TaxID=192903 RepID=A0A1M6G504_9FLAO|nr:GntR family transcriptional regulator [Pseudozobellia thermophila]SHJ04867.1 transcriptional regulator, GntR family [Pseudozobellia thermophila]